MAVSLDQPHMVQGAGTQLEQYGRCQTRIIHHAHKEAEQKKSNFFIPPPLWNSDRKEEERMCRTTDDDGPHTSLAGTLCIAEVYCNRVN